MDRQPAGRPAKDAPPDLPSQLEALLHEVWMREAEWRLDDRIDLALSSVRRHRQP